MNGLDSLV